MAASVNRETREYQQGKEARETTTADIDDCPYSIGDDRRRGWMTGWLDANTNRRLGYVFAKHGMTHP
jgi:ribosome modulation factor